MKIIRYLSAAFLLLNTTPASAISPEDVGLVVEDTRTRKVRIKAVRPGSPAHKAEVPAGSILLKVQGRPVTSVDDYHQSLAQVVNDTLNITITLGPKLQDYDVEFPPRLAVAQVTEPKPEETIYLPNKPLATAASPKNVAILRVISSDTLLASEIQAELKNSVATRKEFHLVDINKQHVLQYDDTRCTDECIAGIFIGTQIDLVLEAQIFKDARSYVLRMAVYLPQNPIPYRELADAPNADGLKDNVSLLLDRLIENRPLAQFELPKRPDGKPHKFYIESFSVVGLGEDVATSLTETFTAGLQQIKDAKIITQEDIRSYIELERKKQVYSGDCDDASCYSTIADALGADYRIRGIIAFDNSYEYSFGLSESNNISVNRLEGSFHGLNTEFRRAMRYFGRQLVGVGLEGRGSLGVSGPNDGATVLVNDEPFGEVPIRPDRQLLAGLVKLTISQSGYEPLVSDVIILPGEENVVWAELKPVPIYRRWWFWTAIGVAAAGIGTATYLGLRQTPDTGSGTVVIAE